MNSDDWLFFGIYMVFVAFCFAAISVMYVVMYAILMITDTIPGMIYQIFQKLKGDKNGRERSNGRADRREEAEVDG